QLYLLASDAGYGFVTQLSDLQSKNRAGKAALSLPKGSKVLQAAVVNDYENDYVVAVSNEGRMLLFPLAELPKLARGKGNKILSIPTAKLQAREEWVVGVQVLSETNILVVHAGKRYLKLKFGELEHYQGERGRRGNKLPRGFQKVDKLTIE
ncbi:MAG: topoisomerase-4 subunit A, partial [Halieaceae bacterium]